MTDKERIKMLEKRVAELESCVGATAHDVLSSYLRNKLKDLQMGAGIYHRTYARKPFDEATNFERNCKSLLKSVFRIPSIRELEYQMIADAKTIVDVAVEVYKKQRLIKAQEQQGETNERN